MDKQKKVSFKEELDFFLSGAYKNIKLGSRTCS